VPGAELPIERAVIKEIWICPHTKKKTLSISASFDRISEPTKVTGGKSLECNYVHYLVLYFGSVI